MADQIGYQFGDYRLTKFLGNGTFGDVYLGEHVYERTQAAIKLLQAKLSDKELKEFINEASIIFRLKHPNIVQLLAFGIGRDDIPFLAMNFAPNGTLSERHPRGTRLSPKIIISYVTQIAAALQFAHDRGLIHRDVKPENVLLGPNNEVLLSDFGIAVVKHSTYSQKTENKRGTALYMAPEQWKGKPVAASDQYALGIMVYEWLCGESPFGGDDYQLMFQHLHTDPPSLLDSVPSFSSQAEHVVRKALAKDPAKRFTNIEMFAKALEGVLQTKGALNYAEPKLVQTIAETQKKPVNVVEISKPEKSTPLVISPRKKRISRRAMIISLIAVGVGAAGGGTLWWIRTPRPLLTYSAHSGFLVSSLAWSHDGKRIASADTSDVRVWDGTNGTDIYVYYNGDLQGNWTSIAWSPDGTFLASANDNGAVQIWETANGTNRSEYAVHGSVNSVSWSPNGKHLASGGDDKLVHIWDPDALGIYTYTGHSDVVNSVIWSPDSKLIASGSADKTVQVWNALTGGNVFKYTNHTGNIVCVAWSPKGTYIASAGTDGTVQVWNASDGSLKYMYKGQTEGVNSIAWSPDGTRIASAGNNGTVQVWNAENGQNYASFGGQTTMNLVTWSPDGNRLALTGSDGTIQIWHV